MRRGERDRRAARSERIIRSDPHDTKYKVLMPQHAERLPRGREKIRELSYRDRAQTTVLLGHISGDSFGTVGHDVFEAAEALSVATAAGAAIVAPSPPEAKVVSKGKAVALPPKEVARFALDLKSLPKPVRHLLAGAFSGGVSKTATAPIEAIRMKMMGKFGEIVASTWQTGGLRAFFNGNFADVIRTAPQKSVQLASFDLYKRLATRGAKPDPKTGRVDLPGWVSTAAGSLAGVTSTVTCFPLEVLRTRLACSTEYPNMAAAVFMIARKEGLGAFYGGLGPSIVGVIPYAGCNLGMYDGLRWLYRTTTGQEKVPNVVALCIGSVAGVSAATITFPLEVVRRRMMMGQKYANTVQAMVAISKAEGTGALFKGCVLNWAKLAPSAGLSFYFYEVAKENLGLTGEPAGKHGSGKK